MAVARAEKAWFYKIEEMLKSSVDDVDEQVGALHDKLQPLTVNYLTIFAEKADPNFKVIDAQLAEFSEWQD